MALWCRRVAHRPVTAKVEGSSPFRVVRGNGIASLNIDCRVRHSDQKNELVARRNDYTSHKTCIHLRVCLLFISKCGRSMSGSLIKLSSRGSNYKSDLSDKTLKSTLAWIRVKLPLAFLICGFVTNV